MKLTVRFEQETAAYQALLKADAATIKERRIPEMQGTLTEQILWHAPSQTRAFGIWLSQAPGGTRDKIRGDISAIRNFYHWALEAGFTDFNANTWVNPLNERFTSGRAKKGKRGIPQEVEDDESLEPPSESPETAETPDADEQSISEDTSLQETLVEPSQTLGEENLLAVGDLEEEISTPQSEPLAEEILVDEEFAPSEQSVEGCGSSPEDFSENAVANSVTDAQCVEHELAEVCEQEPPVETVDERSEDSPDVKGIPSPDVEESRADTSPTVSQEPKRGKGRPKADGNANSSKAPTPKTQSSKEAKEGEGRGIRPAERYFESRGALNMGTKVHRRLPTRDPMARKILEPRNWLINALLREERYEFTLAHLNRLLRDDYEAANGRLQTHTEPKGPKIIFAPPPMRQKFDEYLAALSRTETLKERRKLWKAQPLFLSVDGGRLLCDDSKEAPIMSEEFYAVRDDLACLLIRRQKLTFQQIVALRRFEVDLGKNQLRFAHQVEVLQPEVAECLAKYLEAVSHSGLSTRWGPRSIDGPLLLSSDGEELTADDVLS